MCKHGTFLLSWRFHPKCIWWHTPMAGSAAATNQWGLNWGGGSEPATSETTQGAHRNKKLGKLKNDPKMIIKSLSNHQKLQFYKTELGFLFFILSMENWTDKVLQRSLEENSKHLLQKVNKCMKSFPNSLDMCVLLHVPPHSMVSSSGVKPSGHLSKQRPLWR